MQGLIEKYMKCSSGDEADHDEAKEAQILVRYLRHIF